MPYVQRNIQGGIVGLYFVPQAGIAEEFLQDGSLELFNYSNGLLLVDVRQQRMRIFSRLDGLQSSALTIGDTSRAAAIETAKQSLRDITQLDISACQTADAVRAAYVTQWKQIAAQAELASPGLKTAFLGLDT